MVLGTVEDMQSLKKSLLLPVPTAQWWVSRQLPKEGLGSQRHPFQVVWAPSLDIPWGKSHVLLGALGLPGLACILVPETLPTPFNPAIEI